MAKKPILGFGASRATAAKKTTAPIANPVIPAAAPSKPAVKSTAPVLTKGLIAKRAYEIWERKGRPVGKDLENWQQAERELKAALGI